MKKSFLYLLMLSALLLSACSGDKMKMLWQLEQLEAMNRSGEPLLNDTLAEQLADYFDRHGDSNERMRAKYMLGCTYYFLDELPRALETYIEAAGCADTASVDCNYKVLSRIHAQSAVIYDRQILPHSQLKELRQAVYYAQKAKDTIIAIECYAQQANAYVFLHQNDSAIIIKEHASLMYDSIGRKDYAALTLITTVLPLLDNHDINKATRYLRLFESNSGVFDENGKIETGREIFYNIKGKYYLFKEKIDSAELMFRRLLEYKNDTNCLIAGCKGLQDVYERRKIPDSIAKYASLGYELNDSAYSQSEIQSIHKFQASYNYNHSKMVAEQNAHKLTISYYLIAFIIAVAALLGIIAWYAFFTYRNKKQQVINNFQKDLQNLEKLQTELQEICSEESLSPSEIFERKHQDIVEILDRVKKYHRKLKLSSATIEERLAKADVTSRLREMANSNPFKLASNEDFKQAKELVNIEIPSFYDALNSPKYTLSFIEYNVSILIRLHFSPSEITKLTGVSAGYVSNLRRRLLLKVFGIDGTPKEYDERILNIY